MSENARTVIQRPAMLPAAQGLMHPMAQAILENNPTPETLRELMQMQRDWEKDNARKAYAAAFVALKADLPPFIDKDAEVDFTGSSGKRTNYKHASFAGVSEAIKDHLANHGFALFFPDPITTADGRSITVKARLLHQAGHYEEATLSGPPDDSGNKNKLQAVASAVTYLQRYATVGLLGLATKDMPEPEGGAAPKPSADHIDVPKNILALNHFLALKKTKGEIEAFIGKPVQNWTEADRAKLRKWDVAPKPVQVEEPAPDGDNLLSRGTYRGPVVKGGNEKTKNGAVVYHLYGRDEAADHFLTFSKSAWEVAKTAKGTGEDVVISWVTDEFGQKVESIKLAADVDAPETEMT